MRREAKFLFDFEDEEKKVLYGILTLRFPEPQQLTPRLNT